MMRLRWCSTLLILTISGCARSGFDGASSDDANSGDADSSDACVTSAVAVAPIYPSHGANWNDYVSRPDVAISAFDLADQACPASAVGHEHCVHGGELKQVLLPELRDCEGVTLSDEQGWFAWHCLQTADGVRFVSTGLREGVGLRDLLDPGLTWRENRVTVVRPVCGQTISSPLARWWSNPVARAPANPSPEPEAELSSPGTVYVVDGTAESSGYRIAADRVGVVSMPGVLLEHSGQTTGCSTGPALVCVENASFAWIEINGFGSNAASLAGVALAGASHSRVHRTEYLGPTTRGLVLETSSSNRITHSSFGSTGDAAVRLSGATGNLLFRVRAGQSGWGILVDGSPRNAFVDVLAANTRSPRAGFEIANTACSAAGDLTIVQYATGNTDYEGLVIRGTSGCPVDGVTVHGMTASNGASYGLRGYFATNLVVNSYVAINNENDGLRCQDCDGLVLSDFLMNDNGEGFFAAAITLVRTPNVQVIGPMAIGSPGGCAPVTGANVELGADCEYGPTLESAETADTSGVLVGLVTDDSTNESEVGGAAEYGNITDWFALDNRYRYWADEGGDPAAPYNALSRRDECTSGETCRLHDVRAVVGERAHRFDNVASGATCPIDGDDVALDLHSQPNRFLRHAVERVLDGFGDDDGLCESGEHCFVANNVGADQGPQHQNAATCELSTGSLSGIVLYTPGEW